MAQWRSAWRSGNPVGGGMGVASHLRTTADELKSKLLESIKNGEPSIFGEGDYLCCDLGIDQPDRYQWITFDDCRALGGRAADNSEYLNTHCMKRFLLASFSMLIISAKVFAQNDDCNACNESLRVIQNTTIKTSTSTNDEALAVMFKYDYTYWEQYRTSSNHTTEGDAGFAIFSASFASSASSSESREKYEAMRGDYQLNHRLSNSDYQVC
nr:hypothetical protein [Tanacetum cinerariifolium]